MPMDSEVVFFDKGRAANCLKAEGDTVRGPEGASPLDYSTWKNVPGAPISGGGTWTSTTLDPASGLLYVPVGNPAPDYDNSVRKGDKRLMAVARKDGHLYGFDLADNKLLYRTPVTRIENVEEPFAVDKDVHFCRAPGAGRNGTARPTTL